MSIPIRTLLAAGLLAGSMLSAATTATTVATAAAIDASDDTPWTVPTRPPACTKAQADSGDVAGCLLGFYEDPITRGWGTPPAPGVGEGWNWTGYTYSGSPALETWESTYIAKNAAPIGTVPAGRVETHVHAEVLFRGFLGEIMANGYEVNSWVGGYTFRCTGGSNVNGWKCDGDVADLSNHAWGLAIDINSTANPPDRRYDAIGDASACATPMVTDIPRWVVQTAERWGLYWGGYGWSSGCISPDTQRTSVVRDPPHFEFRGTPAQAKAIATRNGAPPPVAPPRDPSLYCVDVVDTAGRTVEQCNRDGRPAAGWRIPVEIDAPASAKAVVVNLTATDATVEGYLTAEDCAPRPAGDRATSNTNYAPGRDAANLAIVPLVDGRICIYRSTPVHSVVDVVGYLSDEVVNEPAMWFTPSRPARIDDTRNGGACAPTGECVSGRLPANALLAVDLGEAPTAVTNLTIVDAAAPGYVAAGDCDALAGGPSFSNVNYQTSSAAANLSVVSGDERGRMCVYSHSDAHVIVDRLGSLDRASGLGWQLSTPRRAIDTRSATPVPAMGVVRVPLGVDAPGAVVNLTITGSGGAGYATVGPCSTMDANVEPATSTVNYGAGVTVANMAFVEAGAGGEVCVFTYASAHVIVDVQTALVDEHRLGLVTLPPSRVHDSRAA
jgi:hypothetical protein